MSTTKETAPDAKAVRHALRLWFLLPHALSLALFFAAFLWMWSAGNNRTRPDLYLAAGGSILAAIALVATLAALVDVFLNGAGRLWPWLLAHLAGLLIVMSVGLAWLGAHMV